MLAGIKNAILQHSKYIVPIIMSYLIAFAVYGVLAVTAASPDPCDLAKVDECALKILIFAQNTSLTLDPKGVDWSCQQEKISVECLQDHNKRCLHGLAQGVMKLVYEGVQQESELKCEPNGPKQKDYYKYVPCINKVGVKIHKCMKDAARNVDASAVAPTKERIPRMCCELHGLEACVTSATKEACDDNHVVYARSVIESIGGNLLETICSKFRTNSDYCKRLSPLKQLSSPKYQSVVPPVISILQTL